MDMEGHLCPSGNGSRGRDKAQRLDIHMTNKAIHPCCNFKYTWTSLEVHSFLFSWSWDLLSNKKEKLCNGRMKNKPLCWEAGFIMLTNKTLACWIRGNTTELFRAAIPPDHPQPSNNSLAIHIFPYICISLFMYFKYIYIHMLKIGKHWDFISTNQIYLPDKVWACRSLILPLAPHGNCSGARSEKS